jgi:hypothetical protein
MYCIIIKPVVMYASETWVLKEKKIRMLSIWEKIKEDTWSKERRKGMKDSE